MTVMKYNFQMENGGNSGKYIDYSWFEFWIFQLSSVPSYIHQVCTSNTYVHDPSKMDRISVLWQGENWQWVS